MVTYLLTDQVFLLTVCLAWCGVVWLVSSTVAVVYSRFYLGRKSGIESLDQVIQRLL